MKIRIDMPFCTQVDRISKANSVQFEDLTPFDSRIIDSFRSVEDLNKFRLNLYNLYKTKVRVSCIKISEDEGGLIKEKQGFSLSSDVFSLTDNDIGRCLPFYVVKEFFKWSKIQHRYVNNSKVLFYDYI